jgi:predicted nuclease of predicted toxin-antitoxin system
VNFLVDDNVDRQIADCLRSIGHHVEYVAEKDAGISDDEVLEMANEKTALLLTADKDFGELVFRQRRVTSGVVLIRLAGLSPIRKAEIVVSAIKKHEPELKHSFSVINPGAVRIRHEIE